MEEGMEEGEEERKNAVVKKRGCLRKAFIFFLYIFLATSVAMTAAFITRSIVARKGAPYWFTRTVSQWLTEKKKKEEPQHPSFVVLRKIEKAREMIRDAWLGYEMCKEPEPKRGRKKAKVKTKKEYLCRTNVLVAYVSDGDEIKILELEEGAPVNGFSITGRPINLAARSYVKKSVGVTILATKRMVAMPGSKIREVVYTPYSKELDVYAVRLQGLSYLKVLAVTASRDLGNLGVFSRAFPGELLADVIPQRLAVVISLVEQIDPYRFLKEEPRGLVREALTVLGANQEEGYRFILSPAGARGQFQIIEDTYINLVRWYPQAQLKKEHFEGTTDPRNAAKAALCLFDSDLSVLKAKHRRMLAGDIPTLGKFLAACYNCGAGCVAGAISKHGKRWEEHLPSETRVYVKKFSVVWEILYGNGKKGGEED